MAEERLYPDPLTSQERDEHERDLISFCDRELDLLDDLGGLDVFYAGGASPLWIEGLSRRAGNGGSVTALELDPDRVDEARDGLRYADLHAPVELVRGDVFDPPLEPGSFDLAYSAGLFHELDVRDEPAEEALANLLRLVRPGGRVATSDFVDVEDAVQIEEERLQDEVLRSLFGRRLYGIGAPERLIALHEEFLEDVRWRVSSPGVIRHLDKLTLAEEEPEGFSLLEPVVAGPFRRRRAALRDRVRREGYTRPATLYVAGTVSGGREHTAPR